MDIFVCPECGHESSYDPWKSSARCANCGYVPRPGDHRRQAPRTDEAADSAGEVGSGSTARSAPDPRRWVIALLISIVLVTPLVVIFYWVLQQVAPQTPLPPWVHVPVFLGFAFLANGLRLIQVRKGMVTVSALLAGAISALGKGNSAVVDLGRSWAGRKLLLEGRAALALGLLRALFGVGLILAAYALRVL